MSVESTIFAALKALVDNRVYRVLAPEGTALPRITFVQVGGAAINFIDPMVPSVKRARIQVSVWHSRYDDAMALMRDVEDTLRVHSTLQTTVLGAPIAVYEPDTRLHGAHQDFDVVYSDA